MQIALDPPSRLVGGGDDPRARGDQIGAALRVGDRGRHELRELRETILDVVVKRDIR